MRRLLPIALLAGTVAVVWMFQELWGSTGVERARHNVVLISLDGLRADHLSGFGYPRKTTPGLDVRMDSAVRFTNAFTDSPDSLQAHASLLTSLRPTAHAADADRNLPLREGITTLGEELQIHDYDTIAFVDGGELDPKWKLNQGFFRYELTPRKGTETVDAFDRFRRKIYEANRWLKQREADERPFFMFFHSRILRPPFFAPHPASETWDREFPNASKRLVSLEHLRALETGQERLTPSQVRHVHAQYDAELTTLDYYLDDWLGRLFDGAGLRDDTIFIVTSTQGMELFEHGVVGVDHDTHFDTSLRIPLLMWIPGVSGRSVPSQVRLIDVMPTLYEILGVEATEPMQGESLVTRMQGMVQSDLPALSESFRTTYEVYSLRADGHRLVHDRKLAQPLLFDVTADPACRLNLASELPEITETMKSVLDEMIASDRELGRKVTSGGAPVEPSVRILDFQGTPCTFDSAPERVVSLVPSVTDTLASLGVADRLVGVTRYCVHPPGIAEGRQVVGGTKNPDIDAIEALEPDLVLANAEENRRIDVERLESRGIRVLVRLPRTVADAVEDLEAYGRLFGASEGAARLVSAIEARRASRPKLPRVPRVAVLVWWKPVMCVGPETYVEDLVRTVGGRLVPEESGSRYPKIELEDLAAMRPDVILLPSEPYAFSEVERDAIAAAVPAPVVFVDGEALTWHGARTAAGLAHLGDVLASALASDRSTQTGLDHAS